MKIRYFYARLIKGICVLLLASVFMFSEMPLDRKTKALERVNLSNAALYNISNENSLFLQNEYATYYFNNLNENFGVNEMGTCGYVALGMLLGYYDSYWDDNFIAEKFEQNSMLQTNNFTSNEASPGIKSEKNLLTEITGNENYKDANDYYNRIVKPNASQYFHFNLIQLGNNLNYYNVDGEREAGGLSDAEIINLANVYLDSIAKKGEEDLGIERDKVTIELEQHKDNDSLISTHSRVSSFTVGKILQGIPVLIAAKNPITNKGHAMIAYDYDVNTGTIYVHTGLKDNGNAVTHITLQKSGYEYLTMAMALDIKTNHSHTDNYKYGANTYCPCSNQTYYQGKVVFTNLYCLGTNATLLSNNVPTTYSNPIIFNYFNPTSIVHMTAQVTSYGYDPHWIFMGWYRDKELTIKVTSTPTNITGDCILYAKWRVDYGWVAKNRDITVNIVDPMENESDMISVGTTSMLSDLKNMGITKISIEIYLRMWKENKGRQIVCIYGGANGTKELARRNFSVPTYEFVDKGRFTIDIEALEGNPNIYVRYSTTKAGTPDVWHNDRLHLEISFVASESDITGSGMPAFTWYTDNMLLAAYNENHDNV